MMKFKCIILLSSNDLNVRIFVKLSPLSWQQLQPQLDIDISALSRTEVNYFAQFQPRASLAIARLLTQPQSSLLVLKGDELAETFSELEDYVATHFAADEPQQVIGMHYHCTKTGITVTPASSEQANFAAKYRVKSALHFDYRTLLGTVQESGEQGMALYAGLLQQTNGGVLILSITPFLQDIRLWQQLKYTIQTNQFSWFSVNPLKPLAMDIPSYPLTLKVILVGDREAIAQLHEDEPSLYQLADYAELESYFELTQAEQQQQWCHHLQQLTQCHFNTTFSPAALQRFYQLLVRESEDCRLVPCAFVLLKKWLQSAVYFQQKNQHQQIEPLDIVQLMQQMEYQANLIQQRTYREILQEQIYVATEGEEIGQINGLSVIEYTGVPFAFGEPSRISCIVQFGDGEIIDVDRKNELAGNIHAKGMMIAEACLANILDLQTQRPFSASLVFEQSYTEIDGDSASLAAFCVLTSALAELPIPQSIAVTGAIDQFGLVHSVGGVNAKIEGFFAICQARGLNGKQGVIIPAVVLSHLSLKQEVVDAVKQQKFHLWAVENVMQATQILFERPLLEEDQADSSEQPSIIQLITQRLEQRNDILSHKLSFLSWLNFFNKR